MKHLESNAVSPVFQSITIAISLSIILYLVYSLSYRFCSLDERPPISHFVPETAAKFSGIPAKVRVGMSINDFPEFDFVANKFKAAATVWFHFDPSLISLDTIGKFSFLRGEIEEKSEPSTYLIDNKIVARYNILLAFKTYLYHGYFPYQDHKIYLSLINTVVSPSELIFESSPDDFLIIDHLDVSSEWRFFDKKVVAGFSGIMLGAGKDIKDIYHPMVTFDVDYFQYSRRHVIIIFLPLILIFLIEIFSLCLNQREPESRATLIQLSTTNITALVAYRFIIETISPRVGYTTLADYLFFLFLGISTFMFFINVIGPSLSVQHKKVLSIGLQTGIISVFIYFFKFWVVC